MSCLSLLFCAVLFASHLVGVYGQGTNATCASGYEWMSNSLGQSPCLVSAYLSEPCETVGIPWVFALTPGEQYLPPWDNPLSATPCRCNTVLYPTISACATCQGQGKYIPSWSTYSANCSTGYVQADPGGIPSGTAVPAWAYLDVTKSDSFDRAAAEAEARKEHPGTNLALLIGGTVAGGVAALALALFVWLRQRRSAARNAPTSHVNSRPSEYGHYRGHAVPPVVSGPLASPGVYDPDDLSTFPDGFGSQSQSSCDSIAGVTPVPSYHSFTLPPYELSNPPSYAISTLTSCHTVVSHTYPAFNSHQPPAGIDPTAAYDSVPEL